MMTELKFRNAYIYKRRPKIEGAQFIGVLPKSKMLEPQVVEYIHKCRDWRIKNVAGWVIEASNNPSLVIEILETAGNYIKFQLKILDERGWSPIIGDPDHMNLRILLHAHLDISSMPQQPQEEEKVGSKRSKIYHDKNCFSVKRIKKVLKLIPEQKLKRRLCKHED